MSLYRLVIGLCVVGFCLVFVAGPETAAQTQTQEKLWCEYSGTEGVGAGKHIVLVSGDDEYRSEEALPMLGKILAVRHGFKCTVLFPVNEQGIILSLIHI